MDSIIDLAQGAIGLAFAFIFYAVQALALMTMARKESVDNGWFAWIPILNVVLMVQIAQKDLWTLLLFLIPCVGAVYYIMVWWEIAEQRGKPGIVALLLLVPVVGFFVPLYIAYGD